MRNPEMMNLIIGNPVSDRELLIVFLHRISSTLEKNGYFLLSDKI